MIELCCDYLCSYHVTYTFQSESTIYNCVNVKERLAQNRQINLRYGAWHQEYSHCRLTKVVAKTQRKHCKTLQAKTLQKQTMMQPTICWQKYNLVIFTSCFCRWSLGKVFWPNAAKKWGKFYFDIGDVTAIAKTVNLQNLLKKDLLRVGNNESGCSICMESVDDDDPEIFHTIIQKIISIAGHLVKRGKPLHDA